MADFNTPSSEQAPELSPLQLRVVENDFALQLVTNALVKPEQVAVADQVVRGA